MKIRCLLIAITITFLNLGISFLFENLYIQGLLVFLITSIGITLLYFWLMEPILLMKKKIQKVEEENAKLEAMRKEFVANVSHELKTPLTSIAGFIETLQGGAIDDPCSRSKFIDIIADETARLKRLIEDILLLSDIESKVDFNKEKIIISNSLEDVVTVLSPIARAQDIQLILEADKGIYLTGNEDKFKQMMVNLIENAIKYSNEGGKVWVTGKMEESKIIISVRDEGIGISEENIERLFERFYRVDKSRSRKVGGTGLGLSIVKHIAALLNADLSVESKLGEGSSFYLKFR